jgi:hypothetical protein
MYHTLEFTADVTLDLEVSPKHPLERLLIQKGMRLRAQMRPHVAATGGGPVELADLFFPDGTATRNVPFACFRFVESTSPGSGGDRTP